MGTRRPRVAVLDDDREFVDLMLALLAEEGFAPVEISLSSADLVGAIADSRADLALLDLRGVTREGGFAVLHAMRADPRCAELPILLCSADVQDLRGHASEIAALPGVAALEKPFRIEALSSTLRRLLAGELEPPPAGGRSEAGATAGAEAWLGRIGRSLRWPVLDAWVPDTRPGMLRCAAAWCATEGLKPFADVSRRTHLPIGAGVPGRVWVSGRAAWIEDLSSDLNFPRLGTARRVGLVSSAAVPVLDAGTTVGVVAAYTTLVRPVDARMLERLGAAAEKGVATLLAAAGMSEGDER